MIPKFGLYLERIAELDSTNRYAASLLHEKHPPEGAVIVADRQTMGRGQAQNTWESEAGKNLTFSLILYPSFLELFRQFELSKAVSLGVVDFLTDYLVNVSIKWPNDIYVDRKKIAGILMEYSVQGSRFASCIIGIGLNVNQTKFCSDAPNPVSMAGISGKTYNLEDCLSDLILKIELRYRELLDNNFLKIDQDYENLLYQKDTWANYHSGEGNFQGKITGVDEAGLLLIQTRKEEKLKFDYKEVTFLP